MPALPWSVRNQARMHTRNADAPYRSATDAMRPWPETASAVAAWLDAAGCLHIAAPCGLFDLALRPTPVAAARRPRVFAARLAAKPWLHEWPRLRVAGPAA